MVIAGRFLSTQSANVACRFNFIVVSVILASPGPLSPQGRTQTTTRVAAPAEPAVEYPKDRAGILILAPEWVSLPSQMPQKNHLKHALAPALTYGAVPATAVSDYEGLHAQVQLPSGRPVICVCHIVGIPGNPLLVRLHSKKDYRELDGGKIHIGAKPEEVQQTDLVPISVTTPESTVWLIQPQQALPEGEYALMLGNQNVNIFPFTIISDEKKLSTTRP
jgi:hypothetical protein